jgi:hypothetical protein
MLNNNDVVTELQMRMNNVMTEIQQMVMVVQKLVQLSLYEHLLQLELSDVGMQSMIWMNSVMMGIW